MRFDSGIVPGSEIGVHYDPILAKLIVRADTRAAALRRLRSALRDTVILGVATNASFLEAVLSHPAFERGETYTDFVSRHLSDFDAPRAVSPEALALAALAETPVQAAHRETSSLEGEDPWSPWTELRGFRQGEASR